MGKLDNRFTVIDNRTGEKVEDFVFVLRPEQDEAALLALAHYAAEIKDKDEELGTELAMKVMEIGLTQLIGAIKEEQASREANSEK